MTSVTRSAKKARGAENSSSAAKHSGGRAVGEKGSPVSRPEVNDISALRSRESVVKRREASCSSSDLRKSKRLENRSLTASPSENKLSSEEKRSMPSPPSKCERANNQHCSSSSNGKRFEKESGLSESKECKKNQTSLKLDHLAGNKQENVESVIDCEQEDVEAEMWQSEEDIKLVRKKRLDARTFRKIIGPKIKDARNSGDDRHTKGENRLSQSQGTSHLIVGNDFVDESNCTKVEHLKDMYPNEEGCQAAEFSSCGSDDGERENANLSRKQELHFEKVQDLESSEHPSSTSDCPLPVAFDGIEARDAHQVKNNEMARLSGLAKDTPPAIGRISAGQDTAECHVSEGKDITDMDYDVSATSSSTRTCMDKASVSSSPRIQNEDFVDLCSACAKPKRINTLPEIQNTISFCDGKCHPTKSSCCQDSAYGISRHEGQHDEQCHIVEKEESVLDNHYNENNTCAKCKLGGKLLCCDAKGCVKSYHLSCLDPPLSLVPLGAWFCQACVVKKIKLGIYSVSPGMEAVCDSEEIYNEVSGKLEKQYFVKYKGLAHVHNRWVPERQLFEEAPALIDKFKKRGRKNKALSWSSDWLVPQRLLKKRAMKLLKGEESLIEESPEITNVSCEWLVKWKGLGYEGSTWELDNTPLFTSSEAILLKSYYEQRMRRAKEYSNHKRFEKKILNSRKGPLPTALELPGIASGELVEEYLTSVNKILEFWYRCQNTIVIDDKECIVKTVLFILSLKSYVPFPVLIISASPYLVQWEAAFMQFDQSLNVVVYAGDKNVRSNIQMLEFYEDGGGVMLEVLLSTPEAILEDLDSLKIIDCWGVIVVDASHGSKMSEYLEQIRNLPSDFKLLLASGQIKDDVQELFNILSFLGEENIEHMDQSDNAVELAIFKEKLTQLVAYEYNTAQPKFLEYWVPMPLSNVQLEQYCCILVENFYLLRSCLKNDPVGILSDVLKSARKCCEHPYLVNPTLQTELTKGLPELEYLRIGVNSSGKLEFLDRILFEMKNQGQRVLILFQTVVGAEKISVGNILDDFMRQRFGEETYERVDFGVVKGRRDTALNKFNNIKQGRFVFLLEIRACRSCIKLCSVDAVIIFGSEWNPINDLKALMRIHIDSGSEQLKVFRLYTPFTLEEKLLLLASEDGASHDSSLQNISPATCLALLTWGASYLFQKLDEFHDPSKLITSEACSYRVDLNDVVREVLVDTHKNARTKETVKQLLTEVQYNGTTYTLKGSLVGVAYMHGKDDDVPSTFFWCSLLEGRSPQWKYLPATSQRTRKKTMYYIDEATEIERDEIRKKRQKSGSSTVEPVSLKIWNEERKKALFWQKDDSDPSFFSSPKETTTNFSGPEKEEAFVSMVDDRTKEMHGSDSTPGTISTVSENAVIHLVESEGSRNLRDAQRALHIQLKPVLAQLCHIFRLPDNVKDMAEMLLEYIMNTHHINREAKRILDAFLLSLCWIAASLTRYKINHDKSFLLAKNRLGFECKEQEAESVYSKLKSLKKRFVKETCLPENTTDSNSQEKQPMADIDQFLAKETGGLSTGHQDVGEAEARASVSEQIIVDHLHVYGAATEDVGQKGDSKRSPDLGTGGDSERAHVLNDTCDQIELICKARNEEIEKRQRDEIKHFNDVREGIMENLKSKYGLSVCFSSKFEKLVWHMDKCFGKLTDKQREAREMERRLKARWLQDARAGSLVQSFDGIPLSETQFNLEELRISAESIVCDDCEDTVSTSGTSDPIVESGNSSILNRNNCQVPSVVQVNASAGYAECVDAPVLECSTPSLVEQHSVSMGVPLLVGSPQRDAERAMVSHVLRNDSQEVALSVSHTVDQPTAQFQQSGRSQVPPETRANTIAAGVISEFSNQPQQTPALNATTHGPQFFSADPLQNELEKIHRQKEMATRITDDEKKRLSKEWEKEVEEINKKYKSLIQDADVRLQQTHETLDLNTRRVFLSRILAEAYKYKSAGPKVPLQAAQGMSHTAQQLSLSTSSVPLTSHSEVRVVGSAPPRQVVQHSSALFSGDPLSQQLPVISRASLQVGAEMRATPPHLQMHRPSSSTESIPSSLFTSPPLRQMNDHPRSTAQNLVPAPSDPVLLSNASFDAWLTSQKGQASSRPFDRAMGGSRETHRDNVVCLSDEE